MSELEVPENDDAVFTEDEFEDEDDEGELSSCKLGIDELSHYI